MKSISVFLCFLWLATGALAQQGGTLNVGKDLTYQRGTARAKEEVLEFPYYHSSKPKKKCWAYVVHQDKGCRLIFKADEVQGKKDKSGNLVNQDFAPDHPFQKTLDLIKQDAFFSLRAKLMESKSMEKEGWQIIGGGSAVHKLHYKDSTGRFYALLGVEEPGRKTLTGPPLAVFFKRTRQGTVVSHLSGKSWSQPRVIDPLKDVALHKVFRYVEKNRGF